MTDVDYARKVKNLTEKEEAKELAWLSRAFMDAAVELCDSMISESYQDSPHRNRVPLYLAHHSIELLYKGALLDAGFRVAGTHSIQALRKQCLAKLSDCSFDIPDWLGKDPEWSEQLFSVDMLKDLPTTKVHDIHERLRYVTDRRGTTMEPPPLIDPKAMKEKIQELSHRSLAVALRIVDWGKPKSAP